MGSTSVVIVDIVQCIWYVIEDMQEGNIVCGQYGPHSPQIQSQLRLCIEDYIGLACHNVRCKYLYAACGNS